MPTYKMKLTAESVGKVLNSVDTYNKRVKKSGENLTRQLTEQGVSLAQQNASYMNIYDSGELVNGIQAEYVGWGRTTRAAIGKVHSTAPHSAYCEFGTGVVGMNSPHPEPIPGWTYDENEHGEKGWVYYDKNGKKRWTKGMPSRPYMYDTARMLRNMIVSKARGIFK